MAALLPPPPAHGAIRWQTARHQKKIEAEPPFSEISPLRHLHYPNLNKVETVFTLPLPPPLLMKIMTTTPPITILPSLPHPTFNVTTAAARTHLPDSLIVFRLMLPLGLQAPLHEKQGPKEEEDPHTESE